MTVHCVGEIVFEITTTYARNSLDITRFNFKFHLQAFISKRYFFRFFISKVTGSNCVMKYSIFNSFIKWFISIWCGYQKIELHITQYFSIDTRRVKNNPVAGIVLA